MNIFNILIKIILFIISLFTIQLSWTQSYNGIQAAGSDYSQGCGPFVDFSLLKISRADPVPGISFGFEGGLSHLKFIIGGGTTLTKGKSLTRYVLAYSNQGASNILVPFQTKLGYFNMSFGSRYYLRDTEEFPTSNFFGGLSIMVQHFSRKSFNGQYDDSLYTLSNQFLRTYGDEINTMLGFGMGISAGYQYSFDSGLAFTAQIDFHHTFSFDKNFVNDDYFTKGNPLLLGIGIKYFMEFNYYQENRMRRY